MGFRFRRSIKIMNGVRLNMSKSGPSISFGPRGMRYTVNLYGKQTTSVGIPGTGMSYTTTHGGGRSRTYTANVSVAENQRFVRDTNNDLNMLRSIHKYCDTPVNWVIISNSTEPFDPKNGPRTTAAQSAYDNFKPGFFERILTSLGELHKERLYTAIDTARAADKEEYDAWYNLHELSKKVLDLDLEACKTVLREMHPCEGLRRYGFEIEICGGGNAYFLVNLFPQTDKILPEKVYSLTSTGRLREAAISKSAYNQLKRDYICSGALRAARDIFALLPVDKVMVDVKENVLDTTDGHNKTWTILSVNYTRAKVESFDFENVIPYDALENFAHRVSFLKTVGFRPIDELEITTDDEIGEKLNNEAGEV